MTYFGFDHVDSRVSDLKRVEPFYDVLMPALGFVKDSYAVIDAESQWHYVDSTQSYNCIEYFEDSPNKIRRFFGVIEEPAEPPYRSRIAFWANSTAEGDRIAVKGTRDYAAFGRSTSGIRTHTAPTAKSKGTVWKTGPSKSTCAVAYADAVRFSHGSSIDAWHAPALPTPL